jgi:antitoxin (DNA-binding transcriptional repressor) of toxin-antitoxin stability system
VLVRVGGIWVEVGLGEGIIVSVGGIIVAVLVGKPRSTENPQPRDTTARMKTGKINFHFRFIEYPPADGMVMVLL